MGAAWSFGALETHQPGVVPNATDRNNISLDDSGLIRLACSIFLTMDTWLMAHDRKLQILGFARVGMFVKNNRENISADYQHFLAEHNFIEMIFGRNGYQIVRFKKTGTWSIGEEPLELIVK